MQIFYFQILLVLKNKQTKLWLASGIRLRNSRTWDKTIFRKFCGSVHSVHTAAVSDSLQFQLSSMYCTQRISHSVWVVQAIKDGQAEVCIAFPTYLLYKSILIQSLVVFGATHKYCTYSLSFLFATNKKEKCSCQEKKEITLQECTLIPPALLLWCTFQDYVANPSNECRHYSTNQFTLKGTACPI